ncbi:uncharacterized protein C8Q71DRAFT_748149 [Rhodofomes roseus]|uniref:AB hydrolase-1 domain-containing protein n=1 Tax=Rhodofomes roseus TaxID=34475 RepID=A0ABQ8KLF2_9APHY|nr:uncharacterized protein C8Q71DRAFT_748149 [Rhodofomes roseus]KAH9839149.1 hypothetical protein C8Q71DRAFT_748149 [Rhodofomes roseus]
MPDFCIETHVVDLCHVGEPFVTLAKRYTPLQALPAAFPPTSGIRAHPTNACTLVLAHALGYHKETWEPVISHLFSQALADESGPNITAIWTFDSPDHGESASLNRSIPTSALRSGRVSCRAYGSVILALMRSELLQNPSDSRLVLVGHSAGATGVALLSTYPPSPKDVPVSSIIMIEPWMVHPDIAITAEVRALNESLSQSGLRRRDAWSGRDEARAYFGTRGVWKDWDARVLDLYVRYGLSPAPPTHTSGGVVLSFPRHNEGVAYADLGEGQDALKRLRALLVGACSHYFGRDTVGCVESHSGDAMQSRPGQRHGIHHDSPQDRAHGPAAEPEARSRSDLENPRELAPDEDITGKALTPRYLVVSMARCSHHANPWLTTDCLHHCLISRQSYVGVSKTKPELHRAVSYSRTTYVGQEEIDAVRGNVR